MTQVTHHYFLQLRHTEACLDDHPLTYVWTCVDHQHMWNAMEIDHEKLGEPIMSLP